MAGSSWLSSGIGPFPSLSLQSPVPWFLFTLLWLLWGMSLDKAPEHSVRPILIGRGPGPCP